MRATAPASLLSADCRHHQCGCRPFRKTGRRLSQLIDTYAGFQQHQARRHPGDQQLSLSSASGQHQEGQWEICRCSLYGLEGESGVGLYQGKYQAGALFPLDYRAADIKLSGSSSSFAVYHSGKMLGRAKLCVMQRVSIVENALGPSPCP